MIVQQQLMLYQGLLVAALASSSAVPRCTVGDWDDRAASCVCPPFKACHAVVVQPSGTSRPFRTSCGAGQYLEHDLIPLNCVGCKCVDGLPQVLRRMVFATVPRSGNTWMRRMLEATTKLPTETVFANEAIKPPRNRSVRHDGNTTVQFRAATGLYRPGCGIENNCELISRGSTAVPCVFAKTHSPFLVTKAAERLGFTGSDVGIGTAALVAVRNPLDNYDGWRRYKASKSTKETREGTEASFAAFLQSWSDHINHWGRNSERHGVPTVFYRYEDLTSGVCREQIVRAAVKLSGLWDALELTDLDSLRAAEAYPPHDDAGERIATATGKHGAKYAREDIELALSSPLVRRFGYDTILHSWLKSADGKWQEDSGPKLGLRCYRIWPDTEANPPGKS